MHMQPMGPSIPSTVVVVDPAATTVGVVAS
jgi:hypothetical protein